MAIPSSQFQSLVNLGIDATLSGSFLILLGLGLSYFWGQGQARHRNQLWRVVMVGLFLTAFTAWLPRVHLGWLPAPSAVDWVTKSSAKTADFHELAHAEPLPASDHDGSSLTLAFPERGWVFWAGFIWLFGAVIYLSRFLLDLLQLQWLVGEAETLPLEREGHRLKTFMARDKAASRARLLLSKREITPMSWGFWRPKILLPQSAQTWSPERRELVLLHEWGHILQKDFPFLMLGRMLTVVFWFNPLVWLATRRLAQSREQACDELVLGTGVKPSVYADHLLEIARTLRVAVRGKHAALSMARFSELEGRLIAILDRSQPRRLENGARTLAWLLTAAAVMGSLLSFSPWHRQVGSLLSSSEIRISGLPLSDDDWCRLKSKGIDAAFVRGLIKFGYRDLDLEKILYLRESGVEAHHVALQADLIFAPLQLLEDRSSVCMRADSASTQPKMALEIEGKTYYAMPRCSLLMRRPGFRRSVDPISGKMVDKADAVVGVSPRGAVFYFESKANLEAFNLRR